MHPLHPSVEGVLLSLLVQGYEFRTTVSELAKLFDGSEQLVSISVLPWYVRQVFLP